MIGRCFVLLQTIFEINKTCKTSAFDVMKNKRKKHEHVIEVVGAKRALLSDDAERDVSATQDMATEEEQRVGDIKVNV